MPAAGTPRVGPESVALCIAAVLLLVSGLGGGGRGGIGDLIAQLLAILLVGYMAWQTMRGSMAWRSAVWVCWLPLLAIALPILQLLPIPMDWWAAPPARAELAAQLALAGVAPIQTISLNPGATEGALWSLLPATALFLVTLVLPGKAQRTLLALIIVLALLNVILGMAQLAEGPESHLRFYRPTNYVEAVGFFANRNHLADLLVMSLPIGLAGTAWATSQRLDGDRVSLLGILSGCGLLILLILGIALARSRAGLLLGMLAVLGSLPLAMSLRQKRGMNRILVLTIGVAVMLSVQFALLGILQRLERDPAEDGRWLFAQVTREAAKEYAPLGSGLGTFRQAYQPFEAKHEPTRAIVNHAHNDYLELMLEGGTPAAVLLAIGAAVWVWIGWGLWRRRTDLRGSEMRSQLLARAAWLSASLALLHSAVDYPLRTTANMAVFAVLAAIATDERARRRSNGIPDAGRRFEKLNFQGLKNAQW